MNWMRVIRRWLGKPPEEPKILPGDLRSRQAQVATLMRAVQKAPDSDCTCEEAERWLDVYADRIQRGDDVAALMPAIHHHLECCPDCEEEFEALLRMIAWDERPSSDQSPSPG